MPAVAYDFCWQSSGSSSWTGPVMQAWGIPGGVAYQQLTEYVPVDTVATVVRLVTAKATDCSTAIGDVTITPTADQAFTIAAFSGTGQSITVKAFLDERSVTGATHTKMRAIHAAATGNGGQTQNVDFYLESSALATSLFDDVPFGGLAAQTNNVDANGYLERDAIPTADLRVRTHANMTDLLDVPTFSASAAHVYSIFSTGIHGTNAPPPQYGMQLLVCDDSAAPLNHLFACSASGTIL
jgi:hypothetical protein